MDQAAHSGTAQGYSRCVRSAAMLSWEALAGPVLGGLLALGFAANTLPAGLAGMSWRLSCLSYALLCLSRDADWRQGRAMFALLAPFLAAVVIDAAMVPSIAGLSDLARQLFIIGFAVIVFAAARDPVARRIGLWTLFVAAAAIMADTLVRTLPMLSSGWSYAAARVSKGKSFQGGFNANEVCFAALVGLIAGLREEIVPRWISLPMMAVVALCSAILAARTPLMALMAGFGGAWIIARAPIWAALARHRWLGAGLAALVFGGFLAGFVSQIDTIAHSAFAPQLAGRAALWQIAIGAWPQQPLFGFGPGSFQEVTRANLGKAHFSTIDEYTSLYQLQAGGFHNLWLSVLVERGIVGVAGLFASWCLLTGFALRHGGATTRRGRALVFTMLFALFLRSQVELGGLFDDADGPITPITVMAIALTLPSLPLPRMPAFRARDLSLLSAARTPTPT